jgi:phosphocarrier protein
MITKDIEIINKLGLHARASAKLTQLASKFQCEVFMTRNNRRVNAKSIMGVMMLAAGKGATVLLEAEGADEADCMAALEQLIQDKFGEAE